MAIEWGATDGDMQVGIDINLISETSTSVTVDFGVYWRSVNAGFNDGQTMTVTGTGGTTTHNYTASAPNGSTTQIGPITVRRLSGTKTAGGGPTWTVRGDVSGAYNGGTPWHQRSYTVPATGASVPDTPGVASVSNITATSCTQSWNPPSNNGSAIIEYAVRINDSSDLSNAAGAREVFDGNPPTNWSGLDKGTQHWCIQRARNAIGWSGWSVAKTFTTLTTAPSGVNGAVTFSSVTASGFNVHWNVPTDNGGQGIEGYDVHVSTDASFSTLVASFFDGNSPTSVGGLTRATLYYVRVRPKNATGYGPWSTTVSTTTLSTIPGAPAGVSMASVDADTSRVSWSPPADNGGSAITGYEVQWSADATFATGSTIVADSASPYDIDGLTPGTTYYSRVRAINAIGTGPWSAAASTVTVQGVKVWNGSSFVNVVVYYWDGDSWLLPAEVRSWNGTTWVALVG